MQDNNIKTVVISDSQTGRSVHTTALSNFELAGWENFQDGLYTPSDKLTLAQNVPTKLTFNEPLLFTNFTRQPQIGVTKYPIWDMNDQMIRSYPQNNNGGCSARIQFVAEPASSATGVSIEVSLTIPTFLTIYRESKPLVKGTAHQRISDILEFFFDQNSTDNGIEVYLTALGDDIDIYNANIYLKNW